jgi:PAS domain S-box-containing protein
MEQISIHGQENPSSPVLSRSWRISSTVASCTALVLVIAAFVFYRFGSGTWFLAVIGVAFLSIALLHAGFLYRARAQYRQTNAVLQTKEREFRSVFEHALDTILILDDKGICCEANPAALKLLSVSRQDLIGGSMEQFYQRPKEFQHMWERITAKQDKQGEAELIRKDGAGVFVEFTARPHFLRGRHLMILRDITQRRRAEEAMSRSLAVAKTARQEAEAQRNATLALTQDLRMDRVLDTLLETLHGLVPYEEAQVLLLETETRVFLAREAFRPEENKQIEESPRTFDASPYAVLRKALASQEGILIPDTASEKDWQPFMGNTPVRSWLGVPMKTASQVLGLLSLGHTRAGQFTSEHLRLTGSLALSAAAAIQNARLYEQAEIYRAELERRLADLHEANNALGKSEGSRQASEERFQKLFRATPAPLSVTTLADGRFIDVNEAFERRYRYSFKDLIGRTSLELGFWEHPQDRLQLIEDVRRGKPIRGHVARFRLKSGEWRASRYSAEIIQLDGEACLLVVSDDLPETILQ